MKNLLKVRKGFNSFKNVARNSYLTVCDGNKAVAHVSYAVTDNIFLFPITPSTPAGDYVDNYAATNVENIWGDVVSIDILQSESGVAGSVHGSASGGSLTSTYTNSQGLLLMIPSLFRIAGEMFPSVFHIAARALCKQAWTIYNDHADFYACRSTGFCMLASSSIQEAHDIGLITHLISIESRLPFMHIYDGFRSSHEQQKIDMMEFSEISELVDNEKVEEFKAMALNSENPCVRGSSHPPGIYFQNAELPNTFYDKVPGITKDVMKRFGDATGRYYKPFEYVGPDDADVVIALMCSGADVVEETINLLNKERGTKYGLINVRLYRPWSVEDLLEVVPKSVKKIAVLDKTKEQGCYGEPLYLDFVASVAENRPGVEVYGGRYGVGGKEFTPSQVNAVFQNLEKSEPKNHFTVGITDDLSNTSIDIPEIISTTPEGMRQCVFFGMGGDGTLIANQKAIEMIGLNTDHHVQAFFQNDAKKSLSLTISHLRFSPEKIQQRYTITSNADYVACHHSSYVEKFEMTKRCKENGVFVLNSPWYTVEELEKQLPNRMMKDIADKNLEFYNIDASKIAEDAGLQTRINMIMQTVFFKLSNILPGKDTTEMLKEEIVAEFKKKGQDVVDMNVGAVDKALENLQKVEYPKDKWAQLVPEVEAEKEDPFEIIHEKLCLRKGPDALPVSQFLPHVGGKMPSGTTKYDKRKVASIIPKWDPEKCIQCTQCSFVCPHSVIRPFLVTEDEVSAAPVEGFTAIECNEKKLQEKGLKFRIQTSPMDCTSCGNCIEICPADALSFASSTEVIDEDREDIKWDYAITLPYNRADDVMNKFTVKGSQLRLPYLEFPGSCAGCAESAYVKLVTQLYGDRMVVSNPAGCSSIWAKTTPSHPYSKDKHGFGPSYSCPLFENNAEFGFGHLKAYNQQRNQLQKKVQKCVDDGLVSDEAKAVFAKWLENYEDAEGSREFGDQIKALIDGESGLEVEYIKRHMNLLAKGSSWIIGGDGWAYDINFGGLIHVLTKEEDFNVFVLDSEIYSNTGGQVSKATQIGSTAKFAVTGKSTPKMDLGDICMSLGNVYVGSVSFANPNHLIKTIREAEEYKGPSIIIGYCPCIGHGIDGILRYAQDEQALAVKAGYWPLFNYQPGAKEPFTYVSKKIDISKVDELLLRENRYQILVRTFPEKAKRLNEQLKENIAKRHERYLKKAEFQI